MTPEDAVVLARYVRALCPQQRFDEYTPDAWHDVLGDLPLDGARRAAATVARRQPWVSPAEIVTEYTAARAAADTDHQGPGLTAEIPDADPDNVPAYLAAIRQQRTRAADGQPGRRRPIAELLGRTGRQVGDATSPAAEAEVAAVRRPGPLGVDCPQCGAAIGRPCKAPAVDGRDPREKNTPHSARKAAAAGRTTDPAAARADEQRRRDHYLRQLEQMQATTQ